MIKSHCEFARVAPLHYTYEDSQNLLFTGQIGEGHPANKTCAEIGLQTLQT